MEVEVARAALPVEIVTIGDELLLGFTLDSNGAYLGRKLAEIGYIAVRRTSVGDDPASIESAVREALVRSGAVITTGGLGPTTDDMSKAAVARVFGCELEIDAAHVAWMQERWRSRFGREMPASNMAQAAIPKGATKLKNNHGSAPGVLLEDERGWVAMLPGVPREMRGMTDDTLVPLLVSRNKSSSVVKSLTLRTTGIAESMLGDMLRSVALPAAMSLAYLPTPDGVDLRLTIRDLSAASAADSLARAATALRDTIGDGIYGQENDDLAGVVLQLCREKTLTVSVAESCTGGLLGARLTAIPGSSDVVLGGVIAYHNDAKRSMLGVGEEELRTHGAVSEVVVKQMAKGAASRFNSQVSMAITGIAGPAGGTTEKPVGTVWVAISVRDEIETRRFNLIGDRDEIRRRSAQAALAMLRRRLI